MKAKSEKGKINSPKKTAKDAPKNPSKKHSKDFDEDDDDL